jgi:hypothetical protein
MKEVLAGVWDLLTWKRHPEQGPVIYPLGEQPRGLLIYSPDGAMAVHMFRADRPNLATDDPVGGTAEERAGAYSGCLTYFGTWDVQDGHVVHQVDEALFPNWSHTVQSRPFVIEDGRLTLQVRDGGGRVSNEMIWARRH